ncbi:MAG: protein-L-isoaspartate O-methyltransferase [Rhodoferax sp.]|jgi:protein-L-isoaspartate(D-aspartate) O-methyltransferase|nr:protein-L-isoaspartate O-methyltransferase [Rhodoferax sp.]
MNIELARFNMIEQQIRPWNLQDDSVLELLAAVKREDFVPEGQKGLAFADLEIPLRSSSEESLALGQCMLEPRLEARLLQDLAVLPTETVLEIGTGSGYMAALLGKKALRVLSLEIVPELVTMARENLAKAGIRNVEVRQGDGAQMTSADGGFDVIALSGSVAEVPSALLKLLKVGGRLGAIIGDEPVMRATVVTKVSETEFRTVQDWDTVAPRLRNFPEPSRFKF